MCFCSSARLENCYKQNYHRQTLQVRALDRMCQEMRYSSRVDWPRTHKHILCLQLPVKINPCSKPLSHKILIQVLYMLKIDKYLLSCQVSCHTVFTRPNFSSLPCFFFYYKQCNNDHSYLKYSCTCPSTSIL